jgi:hypothetical protein
MRVYFPTRNDNGVRDMSKSVVLGAYLYDGYRGPAEPPAHAAMNPVNLGGMGMNPNQSGPSPRAVIPTRFIPPTVAPSPFSRSTAGQICPAWGCGPAPETGPFSLPNTSAPSVSAQSSPTPQVTVPTPAAPTAVLVSSGGGTASPATSSTAAIASTASTAVQVYGTPVPVGYPTTAAYIDSSGNTWQFNGASNSWALGSLATTATAASSTAAATTTSASMADQVAAWLSGSTAIGTWSVPNALLAGGVALGVALLMGGSKKK